MIIFCRIWSLKIHTHTHIHPSIMAGSKTNISDFWSFWIPRKLQIFAFSSSSLQARLPQSSVQLRVRETEHGGKGAWHLHWFPPPPSLLSSPCSHIWKIMHLTPCGGGAGTPPISHGGFVCDRQQVRRKRQTKTKTKQRWPACHPSGCVSGRAKPTCCLPCIVCVLGKRRMTMAGR